MNKQSLRSLYKQKRLELSYQQRAKLDDLLLIQLQRLPLPDFTATLLTYWPLDLHGEMNTHLYTRYLQHAIPGLQVAYPIVDAKSQQMKAVLTDPDTQFLDNIYGIPEPRHTIKALIDPQDIDLVFVPLLTFDKFGYRVGYGKGYYDRFLQHCQPDICKVGFSYFQPVDKITDTNHYDVPLNYCITPERIYEF